MRTSVLPFLLALAILISPSVRSQTSTSQSTRGPVAQPVSFWVANPSWGGTGTVPPFSVPTISLDSGVAVKQGPAGSFPLEAGNGTVLLHSGAYVLEREELVVPSHGPAFSFMSTYRTDVEYDGPLGRRWNFALNQKIVKSTSTYGYWNAQGRRFVLTRNPTTGAGTPASGDFVTIAQVDSSTLVLREPGGVSKTFRDLSGSGTDYALVDVKNANGIGLDLAYGADQRLATATDAMGRVHSFSWYATGRLERVVDALGRIVRFRYDGANDLTQIRTHTPVSGTTGTANLNAIAPVVTSFSYGGSGSRLSAIVRPNDVGSGVPVLGIAWTGGSFPRVDVATLDGRDIDFSYALVPGQPSTADVIDRNGDLKRFGFEGGTTLLTSVVDYRNRGIIPGATDTTTIVGGLEWGGKASIHVQGATFKTTQKFDATSSDHLARRNLLELARVAFSASEPASRWRFEYGPLNNVTSVTDARAFADGNVPLDATGHLNLGDPDVQKYTVHYGHDAAGNITQITSPTLATKGDDFGGETSAPIIVEVTRHALTGVPLTIARKQDGVETARLELFYWPLPDFSGADPGSVPTQDANTPIGYLGRIVLSGQGATLADGSVVAATQDFEVRYDEIGNPTSVTDGEGHTATFAYNLRGDLEAAVAPAPYFYAWSFSYDENGNMVGRSVTNEDENGQQRTNPTVTEQMAWDRLGRLVAEIRQPTSATTLETRYLHDPNGNVILEASPAAISGEDTAAITTRVFDEVGLVYSETRGGSTAQFKTLAAGWGLDLSPYSDGPDLTTTTWAYDVNGRRTTETDGRGHAMSWDYHDLGWERSKVDRIGTTTVVGLFDKIGRPLTRSVTDAGGVKLAGSSYRYDELGRVVQTESEYFELDGLGGSVPLYSGTVKKQWHLDANGNVLTHRDPVGVLIQKIHSSTGALLYRKDGLGNETRIAYDANEQVTSRVRLEVDALGGAPHVFAESFSYDALHRMVSHTDPDGKTEVALYDSLDNLTVKTDRSGNVVRYSYDDARRLVSEIKELRQGGVGTGALLGSITKISRWNDLGTLDEMIDDNGRKTSYTYDAIGRVTNVRQHDGAEWSYDHDANGNVIWHEDPNGTVTTMGYDDEDRQISRLATVLAPGVSPSVILETIARDGLGRIVETRSFDAGSELARTTLRYDSMGRLLEQDVSLLGGSVPLGTARREHDEAGRIARLVYPGSSLGDVFYQYSPNGWRLDSIATGTPANSVMDLAHHGLNRQYTTTFHASHAVGSTDYTSFHLYDVVGRLDADFTSAVGALNDPVLVGTGYDYDASSRRTYRLDGKAGVGDTYAYDSANRVVGATLQVPAADVISGSVGGGTPTSWTLDGVDNRIDETGPAGITDYALDPGGRNQYVQIDVGASSEALAYDANGNMTEDGQRRFTYDFRNRLVDVVDKGTSLLVASYRYDAFDRRVAKLTPASVSYRYWFGNRILEDVNGLGVTTWRHVHGTASITDPLFSEREDGAVREVYAKDGLGSVVAVLSDIAGGPGVLRRYAYGTFGAMTARDANGQVIAVPTDRTVFGFTGHVFDPETGFNYMRHRYYSPRLGRFISQDPAGYVDGMNLYAYVRHDPVNATDPLGLWSWGGFVKGVALAIGAVAVVAVVAAVVATGAAIVGAGAVLAVAVDVIVAVGTAGVLSGATGAIIGVGGIAASGVLGGITESASAPPPPRRGPAGEPGPMSGTPNGPRTPGPASPGLGLDDEDDSYDPETPGGGEDVDLPEGSGEGVEEPEEPEGPESDEPQGGDVGPDGGPGGGIDPVGTATPTGGEPGASGPVGGN